MNSQTKKTARGSKNRSETQTGVHGAPNPQDWRQTTFSTASRDFAELVGRRLTRDGHTASLTIIFEDAKPYHVYASCTVAELDAVVAELDAVANDEETPSC